MARSGIILVVLVMVWMLEIHLTTPQYNNSYQTGVNSSTSQPATLTGSNYTNVTSGILPQIHQLLIQSQDLNSAELKMFVDNLYQNVTSLQKEVQNSAPTILAVVDILKAISANSTEVTAPIMENVLKTVDVLVSEEAYSSWHSLSPNSGFSATANLLRALEGLSAPLEGEISISTPHIQLTTSSFNRSYRANLTSTVYIEIPDTQRNNAFVTTLTFSTLGDLMPSPVLPYSDNDTINADVVLVTVPQVQIHEVHVKFNMKTFSPNRHICVLWDHELRGGVGSWTNEGCYTYQMNETVDCYFSRPSTFSLLNTHTPTYEYELVHKPVYISLYFGAGVNTFCVLICLILEGCFWKSISANPTSLMRHMTIINMAISVLVEDCTIGFSFHLRDIFSTLWKCVYLIVFLQLFCVSLISWMLVSSLLLFFRTSLTFSNMSSVKMLIIGFAVGYGVPLLIVTITVVLTAPQGEYAVINDIGLCLPNFNNKMALLCFGVPVGAIVQANLGLLSVVLYRLVRSSRVVKRETNGKMLMRLVFLLVFFLLFGLTNALAVGAKLGTIGSGFYHAFGVFNSLQGFWILMFGPLYDSRILMLICKKIKRTPDQEQNS